jgi:hypothetical protein
VKAADLNTFQQGVALVRQTVQFKASKIPHIFYKLQQAAEIWFWTKTRTRPMERMLNPESYRMGVNSRGLVDHDIRADKDKPASN